MRFVALARLSTLLICFILNGDTTTCTQFFSLDCVFTPKAPCADPKVHRAPGGYPGDAKEEDGQQEATASEATANLRSAGENCLAKAATSDMAVDESAEVASSEPALDAEPGAPAGASDADASAPSDGDGAEPGVEDVSQFGEGLSEPSSKVVGLKQQCEQIWDAMHQNRIWRPMIFICIHALVPGNGDAFNSFTQGCARECTDPDTGELLPEFGFCERNEQDELIDVSVTLFHTSCASVCSLANQSVACSRIAASSPTPSGPGAASTTARTARAGSNPWASAAA